MKVNEIITTSNKVLNTTHSLYTESESNNTNARCKTTKFMDILKLRREQEILPIFDCWNHKTGNFAENFQKCTHVQKCSGNQFLML